MMSDTSPAFRLRSLNQSIQLSVMILREHRKTIEEFLVESLRMESVGPVLAPSLWLNPERQATEAALKPLYEAAITLLNVFNEQQAKFKDIV